MTSMTSVAEARSESHAGMSFFDRLRGTDSLWDDLTHDQKRDSIQRDVTTKIGPKDAWGVRGVLERNGTFSTIL